MISNFAQRLLPHQGLILVPGADTRYRQPTPSEWVATPVHMALGRRVELCAFARRTPADQPVLRASAISRRCGRRMRRRSKRKA